MKILIIDTSYLIYRSYFAYPNLTANEVPVGAFFGFAKTSMELVKKIGANHLVFANDSKAKTWRHKEKDDYKAGRAKAEDNMVSQIPIIKEWCNKVSKNTFEVDGFEADDIIKTISDRYKEEEEIFIFSADKDLYQLLYTPKINIIKVPKRGGFDLYNHNSLLEEFDLSADQWIDYKALVGDNSDNLPGVPGIGPKTASKILNNVGCLYHLFEELDWDNSTLLECFEKGTVNNFIEDKKNYKLLDKIASNMDDLLSTYRLAQLQDVPNIVFNEESQFNFANGLEDYQKYNFKSLITMMTGAPAQVDFQQGLF